MDLGLGPGQVEGLAVKASGLFIWCATVFRYIDDRRSPGMDTIDDILGSVSSQTRDKPFESLYGLYQRVLDSAAIYNEGKALIESVLSVVFVASSRQPLSSDAISDILYPNENSDGRDRKRKWVGNIVSYLSAIVRVEEGTRHVRTCHPSVLDFAEGMLIGGLPASLAHAGESSTKCFPTCLGEVHERVFEGCLTVMESQLRFNICELEDSSRLNNAVLDLATRIK